MHGIRNSKKGSYSISGQCRPRSACAFAQSDQGLHSSLPAYGIYKYCRLYGRIDKALIRLRGCACWPVPWLFAYSMDSFPALSKFMNQNMKRVPSKCAHNEDSDQLAHPRSLIRVFVIRMKKLCIIGREDSDQSTRMRIDLNIRWAHMSEGTFRT